MGSFPPKGTNHQTTPTEYFEPQKTTNLQGIPRKRLAGEPPPPLSRSPTEELAPKSLHWNPRRSASKSRHLQILGARTCVLVAQLPVCGLLASPWGKSNKHIWNDLKAPNLPVQLRFRDSPLPESIGHVMCHKVKFN